MSGVGYVWLTPPWDCELAEAPAWLLDLIASSPAPTPSKSPVARQRNPTPDTPTQDWAALLQGVTEGQRHDVAVRAAGHYLGIGIDPEDVEEMLLGFAARCQPPHDVDDIKRIVRDLAAKDAAKRRITEVTEVEELNAVESENVSLLSEAERRELAAHEAAIGNVDFILRWQRYGSGRTDAPTVFHRSSALVLTAMAIDRQRWLEFQHKTIYPSVYILNIAGSGERKTTPMNYAKSAAMEVCADRLLSNDYSPEALIDDLGGREPYSRGTAFVDEAGRILGTMRKGGYGEGLKDLLSELWDAPASFTRTLKSSGTIALKSVFINLVMATTRSRFMETVTPEDVTSGFFARFLPVLVTEGISRRKISTLAPETKAMAEELAKAVAAMRESVDHPAPLEITSEAIERVDSAEQDLEALGCPPVPRRPRAAVGQAARGVRLQALDHLRGQRGHGAGRRAPGAAGGRRSRPRQDRHGPARARPPPRPAGTGG